jgi:hypothetical protein
VDESGRRERITSRENPNRPPLSSPVIVNRSINALTGYAVDSTCSDSHDGQDQTKQKDENERRSMAVAPYIVFHPTCDPIINSKIWLGQRHSQSALLGVVAESNVEAARGQPSSDYMSAEMQDEAIICRSRAEFTRSLARRSVATQRLGNGALTRRKRATRQLPGEDRCPCTHYDAPPRNPPILILDDSVRAAGPAAPPYRPDTCHPFAALRGSVSVNWRR